MDFTPKTNQKNLPKITIHIKNVKRFRGEGEGGGGSGQPTHPQIPLEKPIPGLPAEQVLQLWDRILGSLGAKKCLMGNP